MKLSRSDFQLRESDLKSGDPEGFGALDAVYQQAIEQRFIRNLLDIAGRAAPWAAAITKNLPRDTKIPTGGKPDGWKNPRSATYHALEVVLQPTGDHLLTPLYPVLFPGGAAAIGSGEVQTDDPREGALAVWVATAEVAQAIVAMESAEAIRSALEAYVSIASSIETATAGDCDEEGAANGADAPAAAGMSDSDRRALESKIKKLKREVGDANEKAEGFRGRLRTESKQLAEAKKQLAAAQMELESSKAQLDTANKKLANTMDALTKTDEAKDAAQRGLESVTAERAALRSQVSEIEDELVDARYWKERYELHIKWQDGRYDEAQRQVAARDELLANFGLDNLTDKLGTIGASIAMMTQLFETMQSYKSAVDEQKARQEAELAEYDRAVAEAEEEDRQREAMWEDRAEEHRAARLLRLHQYEQGLLEGGAPDRVIIDGHNLLYQYDAGGDEAASRTRMIDLLDGFVDRLSAVSPQTVVTVVFDSQHNASSVAPRESGLRVEYALNDKSAERGTSGADARIREMLEEGGRDHRYVVLSNDRTDVHSAAGEAASTLNVDVTAEWNYAFATYLRDLDLLGS